MASRDGVGAPRRPSTLGREAAVMEEARRLAEAERRGLRYEDAARVCGDGVSRAQVNYTLQRLAIAGKLERRDGYSWHVVTK